jgi:Tol biopolymer transport system component
MRRAAVAALAAIALGVLSASAGGTTQRAAAGYRILLVSDRDGVKRGYSMRPDGSRLTPLLPRGSTLVPVGLSADGSTIAYRDRRPKHPAGFYVSRADGSGLHRVLRDDAGSAVLSPDGRLLAFGERTGVWIVGTNGHGRRRLMQRPDAPAAWSPDGKALALVRSIGDVAGVLVVRPLHGTGHAVAWAEFEGIEWSPDGRWIAYADDANDLPRSLWLVRPNGHGRHRIARNIWSFSWSPDGKSLAYTNAGDVVVVGVDGRGRRLGLSSKYVSSVTWLPEGRLAVTTEDSAQISIVRRDGHGLRRLTSGGSNAVVGWTRLPPVLPPVRPVPPTERAVGTRTLDVRAQIGAIAADGERIAFITGPTRTDCDHIAIWTPSSRSVARPAGAPCDQPLEYRDSLGPIALSGTNVAWRSEECCGNNEYTHVVAGGLPYPRSGASGVADAAVGRDGGSGTVADGPVGHGNLMTFAIEDFCVKGGPPDYGDTCPPGVGPIDMTEIWRLGGGGRCPVDGRPVGGCSVVAKFDSEAHVLDVDAGRIVVETPTNLEVLTPDGRVVRSLPFTGTAALSGTRLAVGSIAGVDVYDVRSGRRTARFSGLSDLQDLEGDILVAAPADGVILRRLDTGRMITLAAGSGDRARLERPGLFLVGDHRIAFVPMREIRRRLGD